MELVIVTGMSGAGKSQAICALEDIGYYCVDNIPPRLMLKFAQLPGQSGGRIGKVALVVDVRSHELFSEYCECLDELKTQVVAFAVLFLDCEDAILLKRYKETRRRHPLGSEEGTDTQDAIAQERGLIAEAKAGADFVVDTSHMGAGELRARVGEIFFSGIGSGMRVICNSFGFKHGIPADSDLIFDVRCLPNPHYNPELRPLTGLDRPVSDFVMSTPQAQGLIPRLLDLLDYLIPLYITEGKSQLVISVGCTGGRHRSVAFCELLAAHLEQGGSRVTIHHRDINLALKK